MAKPDTPTELARVAGISMPYASQILSGDRVPARPLAIRIFRATGWKPPNIANLSDDQIAMLETIEAAA